MASRRWGTPDLSGHGPRTALFSTARTKASQFLFETISAGRGRNDEGAEIGVCYTSQRQTSGSLLHKMAAWPALDGKQFEQWKRAVTSSAATVPAMASILGSNPPQAPTMEALMERYDLDAVVEAFLQGDYYVFPAEVADNYHSSDERFGTNALSNQVYRKGAPAWNMADAVHEYEERTGKLATIAPAMDMRTPQSGVSDSAGSAQSAPPRLQAPPGLQAGAGRGVTDADGVWGAGLFMSGTDSNVGANDTTRATPMRIARIRASTLTREFKEFVRDVLDRVAKHDVRLQYEARKNEYDSVDRALVPLIVGALNEGQMCCLPGVDEMKGGRELWTALCCYYEGTCESMSSLVQTLDAWTLCQFDDGAGVTAFENQMGVHLRMIKDSEKINRMTVLEFIEMMNMAIMLSRIGKSAKYAEVVAALRREDDLDMSRMRRVMREHERANQMAGGGTSRDGTIQSGFSSDMAEQVCRVFLNTGSCKFGDRCRYSHPTGLTADEKKKLLAEIEKKRKKAAESRKKRADRKKAQESQEKGNAAEVKNEVERQLAAMNKEEDDQTIVSGFCCEEVDSEEEEVLVCMMQCVTEPNHGPVEETIAEEEALVRVIADDITGVIVTDQEAEARSEFTDITAVGRRLRPREDRGVWSGVSDNLWEVRSTHARWFNDEWLECVETWPWMLELERLLEWEGVGGVIDELMHVEVQWNQTTEGEMSRYDQPLDEVDSVETVADDEANMMANSAEVPKVKASDYVFDTGATKHVTGNAESLDTVSVPKKALKFKSASGNIEKAKLKGAKGHVKEVHVVQGWQSMFSVGKYCDDNDCVVVLNSEGAYALPKGKGLAVIIQKHGVRVAERNAVKGDLYRCTQELFDVQVSGSDQGNASPSQQPRKKNRSGPIQSKTGYWPVALGWISAFRCTKPHVLTPNSHCEGSV